MSEAISAKKLLPPQRIPFTPLSTDVFVVEQFNVVQSPNDSIPAYGTPHDNISKLKSWPNHKFCLQTEPDDQGSYQRVYVADQGTQHLYNWETSDASDWPTVTQTFIVPRSTYVFRPPTPETTYPPPPNGNVNTTDYEITSIEEQRIGEPRLDSLYVAVKVTRENTSLTQVRRYVDPDTNTVQEETIQKVPAGTPGSAVGASGTYTDISPLNAYWSTSSTKKAQGLAGNAVLGVASRIMYYRDNYTWPRVLNYIDIQPVLSDPGDIYSPVARFAWRPVWLADFFDGPCNYTMVERWTLAKPIFGGNPNWNTTTGGSPDIPEETPMLKQEIVFNGAELSINIPACLHREIQIWDSQFYGQYPATTPTNWPATVLARVTISPDNGGWLTRMFYVDAPDSSGVSSGIELAQTSATATTFTLTWSFESGVPAGTIKLDVATDPTFSNGFLTGYQDLTVTGTTLQVSGATRGQIYYARVSRGGATSNIAVCLADPQPELLVTQSGQTVLSGGSLSVGSAETGSSVSTTITLNSVGLESLTGVTAVLSGTDSDSFSVTAPPVTLPPTTTTNLNIQFAPTSVGSKTATLTITSSDAASPYILTLTGIGVAAEVQIEQPVGNILVDGSSTVDFGTVTTGSSTKTFRITNIGNTTLRLIEASITGDNADDYVITTPIPVTELEASEYEDFILTFDPVVNAGASETRTATLSITSSDSDESPFTVSLTGVSDSPSAPGAPDLAYNPNANGLIRSVVIQPDGKAIVVGDFTNIVATTRNYIARLNTDGTLDTFNPNANGVVRCVSLWPNGTILIAGDFTTIGGTGRNRIALLNADGTLNAWYPTGGADGSILCIARKDDGKIWIGGSFNTVGGATRKRIALINADASINAINPSVALGISIPAVADVRGLILLEDEKLVLCGYYFAVFGWGFCSRLLADGTVDSSFIGQVYFNGPVNTITVLGDGRVIAAGDFSSMSTVIGTFPSISPGAPVYSRANVMVLDSAGVPTSTLIDTNDEVRALITQADGSVILGGDFTQVSSTARVGIARLESDLVLESAYNPVTNGSVYGISNQDDGKTLITGSFTTVGGVTRNRIARLYNDEASETLSVLSVDLVQWLRSGASAQTERATFELSTDGGTTYADIAGTITRIEGGWQLVPASSLTSDGIIRARAYPTDSHSEGILEDTVTFDVNPEIEVSQGSTVLVDGVSTVAFDDTQLGSSRDVVITITNIGLTDLDLNGAPDKIALSTGTQWSVVSQPTSPIAFGDSVNFTLRFTPTSAGVKTNTVTIDNDDPNEDPFTFNLSGECLPGPGSVDTSWQVTANNNANTVALNASDDTWLGGAFTTVNALNRKRFARISDAGSVLAQTGSVDNGEVFCFCQLPDGKVLIGGSFTQVSGVTRNRLARFTSTGVLDTSFNISVNYSVYSLSLQADGSVIVGGLFTSFGGASKNGIAKLSPTGVIDNSFNAISTFYVINVVAQTDGKLLVSSQALVGGASYLQRLNADGSKDLTFDAAANGQVATVLVAANGAILAGGTYTSIGGASKTGLNRLTSAGVLDATFSEVQTAASSLVLQCDGKLLVGSGSSGSLAATERLVRLSTTGANDTTFVATARQSVSGLALQSDGKVVVAGAFTLAGGTGQYAARLINDLDAAVSALSVVSETEVQWLRGGTTPETQTVVFHYSQDGGATWVSLGQGTRITGGWRLTSVALPISGLLRAQAYIPCGLYNGSTSIHEEQITFSNLASPDLVVEYPVGTTIADNGTATLPGTLPNQVTDVTVTLRNTGNATLSSIVASFAGSAGDFSIVSAPATAIAANGTTTLTLRFAPPANAIGVKSAILSITSNLPGSKNPYWLNLRASAVATPVAKTGSSSAPASGQRTLNGTWRANHDTASAYFQYKLASATTWSNSTALTISGFTDVASSITISGLTPGQSYQYRAIIYNAVNAGQVPASPFVGSTSTFTAT